MESESNTRGSSKGMAFGWKALEPVARRTYFAGNNFFEGLSSVPVPGEDPIYYQRYGNLGVMKMKMKCILSFFFILEGR